MEYRGARGFPAEYGVLGVLLDGAAHGYDVQQRLHAGLGSVWRIAWSQLYHVLHGLEERGWVRSTAGAPSGGPPRHTYAITTAGKRAFFEWADAPVTRVRDMRVEFLAKLYFLRRHRPDDLDSTLERQAQALRQAVDGLETTGASFSDDPWTASAALLFRRGQTRSALDWLDEVRKTLSVNRKEPR